MLARLGDVIYRHPTRTLIVTGLLLVLSVAVLSRGGQLVAGNIEGLEAEVANTRAAQVLGAPGDTTVIALFSRPDLSLDNPASLAAIEHAVAPLRGDPRVRSVLTPATTQPPIAARMVNATSHTAYALITLAGTLEQARSSYPRCAPRSRQPSP